MDWAVGGNGWYFFLYLRRWGPHRYLHHACSLFVPPSHHWSRWPPEALPHINDGWWPWQRPIWSRHNLGRYITPQNATAALHMPDGRWRYSFCGGGAPLGWSAPPCSIIWQCCHNVVLVLWPPWPNTLPTPLIRPPPNDLCLLKDTKVHIWLWNSPHCRLESAVLNIADIVQSKTNRMYHLPPPPHP